jgi:hypothetical protein
MPNNENPLNRRPRLRHGLFIESPTSLRLRERAVRKLCQKAKTVMPWLTAADYPALRSWAELEIVGAQLFANLQSEGPLRRDGERAPRKVLHAYRQMKIVQLQYENALGMTPVARAAINGGDARAPRDFVAMLASAKVEDDAPKKEQDDEH